MCELDAVGFEVMLDLGAFITESSGHFSEYVPYFRKRPDLIARYMRSGYLGGGGFYAHNWPERPRANDQVIPCEPRRATPRPTERRHEYQPTHLPATEC